MRFPFFAPNEYATYVRNFIFGVEDSLVSTVGLLSGIAAADAPGRTIMLTGLVLISVEAFSMGVGSYLSEKSTADYIANRFSHRHTPAQAGLIMMASYFAAGFIPLSPYIFSSQPLAFWLSISGSLIALIGLGALSARMLDGKIWQSSLRMFVFGGLAILIGVGVGELVK
jgi:VIT1/CCC1 family predicted Fe2+/Mn2+ transporter